MERNDKVTFIARAVHEAMRAYQSSLGESVAPVWEDSGWMQDSSRSAVEFALSNPTPGAQHEDWVSGKKRDGWTYGPKKDATLKTHPSLVPFNQLSETEKNKDAIVINITKALATVVDLHAK